jgi:hypothetical protein
MHQFFNSRTFNQWPSDVHFNGIQRSWSQWKQWCKLSMRVGKREFTWKFFKPHVLAKREQELHESWEARVYIRVFSTLMPWSNENKSCLRVEKREFASEFSQLSCPGQTRTRVAWELRSESLHQSFLNSHALVKREQELHESWEARV